MQSNVLITGASGLIGSEAVKFFSRHFDNVIGIDNNMRAYFFGEQGSIVDSTRNLVESISNLRMFDKDIRDYHELTKIFFEYSSSIKLVIHAAAQPSHDWAVKEPFTDYQINSTGTLNLLEATRKYCPDAVFIFTSTSKVYGDNPNKLPLLELDSRFDLPFDSEYYNGISENFSIDNTKHSLFGCSKVSADVYVQEYGRYFGLKTTIFRPGCLTGSNHSAAELHGFLNYLVRCIVNEKQYNIFGYRGKQVRCNIHSKDVVSAFWEVYKNPKHGEVYNLGGGREGSCSILEAIQIIEKLTGKNAITNYKEENRIGDHIWWISNIDKFKNDYPNWKLTYNVTQIIKEIYVGLQVPPVLMDGGADTTYANGGVALDVLRQRYMQFRNMMSQWLKRKIFAPISKIQGFYDYSGGEKQLIVPDIDWNHMSLFDAGDYINGLVTLTQGEGEAKRASVHTLYRSMGLEFEDETRKMRKEAIQAAINAKEKAALAAMDLNALRALDEEDEIPEPEGAPAGGAAGEAPLPGEAPGGAPPGGGIPGLDMGAPPGMPPPSPPPEGGGEAPPPPPPPPPPA